MKLEDLKRDYESKKEELSDLNTEKSKVEERLAIKKEELEEKKKDLESRGINTKKIEEEYKTRKTSLEKDVASISDKITEFKAGIVSIKERL